MGEEIGVSCNLNSKIEDFEPSILGANPSKTFNTSVVKRRNTADLKSAT